eukprot:12896362-Alexandrium_andersonii.AAC.1
MTATFQNELIDINTEWRADFSLWKLRLVNVELLATHLDALTPELGHVVLEHANAFPVMGGHPLT